MKITLPTVSNGNLPNGIYNPKTETIRKLRATIADVKSGRARGKVACIGTSTFRGNGTGTGTNGHDGAQPLNVISRFKDALVSKGILATTNSYWGTGKVADNQLATWDSRLVNGGNWGATAQEGLGGDIIRNNTSSSATAVAFTPTGACDTIDLFYRTDTGAGSTQLSVGGTLSSGVPTGETNLGAAISHNAAANFLKVTRSTGTSAAQQVFNIKRTGASTAISYIQGWDCYNSAIADLAIYNMGRAGGGALTFLGNSSNPINPPNALATVAPQIVIIECGINDWNNPATAVGDFTTNLNALVVAAVATGAAVILCGPPPTNPDITDAASIARQAQFLEAIKGIALTRGCLFVNFTELLGSYTNMVSLNLSADANHANRSGAYMMGAFLAEAITI